MDGWIFSVTTKPLTDGAPLVEYYAVHVADRAEAEELLRSALGILDEKVQAEIPKTAQWMKFMGVPAGNIRTFPVMPRG